MSAKTLLLTCSITFIVAFATACENETLVTKIDPNNPGSQRTDGVLFSLPETVVIAEVPLSKVDSTPGLFSKWTGFFYPELTPNDYITEEKTTFKVGAPTFTTRGQTDPKNVYLAHIKAKRFETKTLLLEMNEDGIIVREEASSKDETIDIVTSGLKTAASIVAPLLPGGFGAAADKRVVNRCTADELFPELTPAQKIALSANDLARACFEVQLSKEELALYEVLDPAYHTFLRNTFGYALLTYFARKDTGTSSAKPSGIEFFFTLNKDQRDFIIKALSSPAAIQEFIRAKTAYDKIQALRARREDLIAKDTPSAVNTSTNLELKLKEVDAQIKNTEQAYFLGSSSEASANAKFEFKPSAGDLTQHLFTYAAGGSKPGVCAVSNEGSTFKAIWPRKFGDAVCRAPASHLLELGDFRDLEKLRARFNSVAPGAPALPPGAVPDLVSIFLYGQLTPGTRVLLQTKPTSPQARKYLTSALITDLNTVVNNGASIYGAALFANEKLSTGSLDLLAKPMLSAAEIRELNRSLIDDVYSNEIYRQRAWASRQVSLELSGRSAGMAQSVDNAQLKEPGKRGFPYRVPASSLAKLMDDKEEKGRSELRIAQLGPVQTLPAGLGGRRASYKITYYDASGAIKIFDMSADALIQKQNITDLTDAATSLRDSETAKLKRETEILKAKKEKLDAEKALKTAQGEPSLTPTP